MPTASRLETNRALVRRAAQTGAAARARKKAALTLSAAARMVKVHEATYCRWERGITMPTHGENLRAFARLLVRLGVEDDPEMRADERAA